MMNEFGWTRAMTSGAASLRSIEGGVAGPVVGWAVDKYGARRVIIFGGIVSGLGFAMMPFVNSLLGFYLAYGILVSIGMSAMLYLPAFTVIAKWFRRKLSRALAVLAVGAGLGGLVCAPAATLVIQHFGWRIAFLGMGILMWLVVIPLAMVVRERPEDMGLRPDGDPPQGAPGARGNDGIAPAEGSADYTLKQALASSAFWVIAITFFFSSLSHSVVFVHAIPALTDAGISAELAAFSVGLLTVVSIAGRLSFGYLGDFVDKRYLFLIGYTLQGAGVLILMIAREMTTVYLFVAVFGVGFGSTVPLLASIRADYFGRAALGKIQGFMSPVTMVAGATGPVSAGYLFDTTGSYQTAFLAVGLLTIAGGFIILLAKPRPAAAAA
jgi:MFS family permease